MAEHTNVDQRSDTGRPDGRSPIRTAPAARALGLSKIYGSGDTQVAALDGVNVEFHPGQFTAIMGPSGSGKSTLMHCLAALDDGHVGAGVRRRRRPHHAGRQGADQDPPGPDRVRLPVVQPGAHPDRDREHHPADGYRRPQTRPGLAGHRHHHRRPGRSAAATSRANSPAVNSSGSPAPGRWPGGRTIIFADEPTGNLDSVAGAEVLGFLRRSVREFGQTVVMVTHDPVAAGYADRVLFLADGRIVDEMTDPTAERVLDRMKSFDTPAGTRGVLTCSAPPLKSLLAHKLRMAMSAFAIVLGVAFVAGSLRVHRHPEQQLHRTVPADRAGRHRPPGAIRRRPEAHRRRHRGGAADLVDELTAAAGRRPGRREHHRPGHLRHRHERQGHRRRRRRPGIGGNYDDAPAADGAPIVTISPGFRPGGPGQLLLDEKTAAAAGYSSATPSGWSPSGDQPAVTGTLVGTLRFGTTGHPGRAPPWS